jgi:hypothetical protein
MHGPINVKSPNNTSKWQMGFNSAFKQLLFKGSLTERETENTTYTEMDNNRQQKDEIQCEPILPVLNSRT